jgi:hypothetical protein
LVSTLHAIPCPHSPHAILCTTGLLGLVFADVLLVTRYLCSELHTLPHHLLYYERLRLMCESLFEDIPQCCFQFTLFYYLSSLKVGEGEGGREREGGRVRESEGGGEGGGIG